MKAEVTDEGDWLAGVAADRALGAGETPVSRAARERMEAGWADPFFLADWDRALFLHYEVDAEALQAAVPFELDLWEGERAMVSLVAFTMRGMKPSFGGAAAEWLSAPLATHEFLNVRTYVRRGDEPGIFFIREWMPNVLARCVGPLTFGLPYRLGVLDYRHHHESGELSGEVRSRCGRGRLSYRGAIAGAIETDEERRDFLLERFTAYTSFLGLKRKFRVWHEPWQAVPVAVDFEDESLLDLVPGCSDRKRCCAHYSAGVDDVWMGRPRLA